MLQYSEITERKYIVLDGDPYEVLSSHVFRKQQRKPVNATKLKNMITGKVTERSFHVSEKVEEAELEKNEIKFLYQNNLPARNAQAGGQFWFCDKDDPSNRFSLEQNLLGTSIKFLKENSLIEALLFQGKIIGVKMPIKVELKVTESHPAVKGNTAQGATKEVVLETGATIQAPLFIKEGDILRINTETGGYAERV